MNWVSEAMGISSALLCCPTSGGSNELGHSGLPAGSIVAPRHPEIGRIGSLVYGVGIIGALMGACLAECL